ncbi:MAG: 2Fe-2S iron-sulfur cluster-binding protein [Bacteroidota bacterium]
MKKRIQFKIDGKVCETTEGTLLLKAAEENGVYIPRLCHVEGLTPRGACRVCTVKLGRQFNTACTMPVTKGMEINNHSEELEDLRKSILEMMFAEGNHICPSCEKSGNCELQALARMYGITVPRYPFLFPDRDIEATHPKLLKDHNRCILCKRCIRLIKDEEGKRLFAFSKRGSRLSIKIDTHIAAKMSDELAVQAVNCCPVGALLPRKGAFQCPIGKRVYDKSHIDSL